MGPGKPWPNTTFPYTSLETHNEQDLFLNVSYYGSECFVGMYVGVPYVYSAHKEQKSIGSPGTGVTKGCELSLEYWGEKACLFQEQQMLLTPEASPLPGANLFDILLTPPTCPSQPGQPPSVNSTPQV